MAKKFIVLLLMAVIAQLYSLSCIAQKRTTKKVLVVYNCLKPESIFFKENSTFYYKLKNDSIWRKGRIKNFTDTSVSLKDTSVLLMDLEVLSSSDSHVEKDLGGALMGLGASGLVLDGVLLSTLGNSDNGVLIDFAIFGLSIIITLADLPVMMAGYSLIMSSPLHADLANGPYHFKVINSNDKLKFQKQLRAFYEHYERNLHK